MLDRPTVCGEAGLGGRQLRFAPWKDHHHPFGERNAHQILNKGAKKDGEVAPPRVSAIVTCMYD